MTEQKLTIKPEYFKVARSEAAARGIIYLLNSLNLTPDEAALGLVQAVGISIANQVPSYDSFQAMLAKWTDILTRYAAANRDALEKAIHLNQASQKGSPDAKN